MKALEKLLIRERENYKNAFIITESVFSMDGDIEDLKKIIELKKKYNCNLIIDEAHAFGVFGEKGLGVAEELGIINDVDLNLIKEILQQKADALGITLSKYMLNCALGRESHERN